jgi:hypothetical protein
VTRQDFIWEVLLQMLLQVEALDPLHGDVVREVTRCHIQRTTEQDRQKAINALLQCVGKRRRTKAQLNGIDGAFTRYCVKYPRSRADVHYKEYGNYDAGPALLKGYASYPAQQLHREFDECIRT